MPEHEQLNVLRFLGRAKPVVVAAPEHDTDLDRLAALVRAQGLHPDRDGSELIVPVDGDARSVASAVNKAAFGAGIVLAELHVRRPSLESHYLTIVEGGDR
jgi:hypothetical protein